jgi:predicted RNA binding protein YcfA (HicA-like mRNA interferase family)
VGRLATIVAFRLIRAFNRLGWVEARQTGSHVILQKPGHPHLAVPSHKGRTMKEGTVRGILKSAGVSEEDFFEVY